MEVIMPKKKQMTYEEANHIIEYNYKYGFDDPYPTKKSEREYHNKLAQANAVFDVKTTSELCSSCRKYDCSIRHFLKERWIYEFVNECKQYEKYIPKEMTNDSRTVD